MIWQNPWAWLGLSALALPLLIHLLGRGHARKARFPSLRFLPASQLLPTRRTRIHDPLLLLVRLAILAFAAAALAQPLWVTAVRDRSRAAALARVLIVDTSASTRRATSTGRPALDVARTEAKLLADSAKPALIVETAAPRRAVAGAAAWLEHQPVRGEIVVLSDFQLGTLGAEDVAATPRNVGIRLVRISASTDGSISSRARTVNGTAIATATVTDANTVAEWKRAPEIAATTTDVELLAAPADAQSADAALHAAHSLGAPLPADTTHHVAIVYPGYPARVAVVVGTGSSLSAWMTNLISAIHGDSLLVASLHDETVPDSFHVDGLVVARSASGLPVLTATADTLPGHERLLLHAAMPPGSLASAALIAAVERATSLAPVAAEADPSSLPDSLLSAWQRPPAKNAPRRAATSGGESDGRWLWIGVIALLVIEMVVRRSSRERAEASVEPMVRERVA